MAPRRARHTLGRSALTAATTLAAVIASFCLTYVICRRFGAQPQPAIVAAILAIGLSRSARPAADALLAPVALVGIALIAGGVGRLLHASPALGAAVFTGGMFFSVYLRNFGARARALGALIALPLVAMLVVPPPVPAPGGPFVDLLLLASAGAIALASATATQWAAPRLGFAAAAPPQEHAARDVAQTPAGSSAAARSSQGPPAARSSPGPSAATQTSPAPSEAARRTAMTPATRMACQMAVALAAAFVVGFGAFPGHWGWCVLTAFIVCSGARGRGDAAYKGVLRLGGALAGTAASAALAYLWNPGGPPEAIAIFAILFVGLWLRDVNYAYWAACMTLVLALLSGTSGGVDLALLGVRLEAILAGAVCAVAAAWFVFPIRTEAVIRRRLADALAAFDDLVAHAHVAGDEREAKFARFTQQMAELDAVAPPVRWHRRVFARARMPEHPAGWIDLANGLHDHAHALTNGDPPPEEHRAAVRRAIGASRRSIANHGKLDAPPGGATVSGSLRKLRDILERGAGRARA